MSTISSLRKSAWENAVLEYMQTYDISDIQKIDADPLRGITELATELAEHCSSAVCNNFAYLFTSATMVQDALFREEQLELIATKAQERNEGAYAKNEGLKRYLQAVEKKRVLLKTAIADCQTALATKVQEAKDVTQQLNFLATGTEAGQAERETLTQAIAAAESKVRECASEKVSLQQALHDLNAQITHRQQQHAEAKNACKEATDASVALQNNAEARLEEKQNEVQRFITTVSSARIAGFVRRDMTLEEAIRTVVNQKEEELRVMMVKRLADAEASHEVKRDKVKKRLESARKDVQTKLENSVKHLADAQSAFRRSSEDAEQRILAAQAAAARIQESANADKARVIADAVAAQAGLIRAEFKVQIDGAKAQAKACEAKLKDCENTLREKNWNPRPGVVTRSRTNKSSGD